MTDNNPVSTNCNNNGDEHNDSTYMNQQASIVEQQQDRENSNRDTNLELPFEPSVGVNSETTSCGIHHQDTLSPSHVLSPSSFTNAVSNYLSVEARTGPSILHPSITPTTRQHYSHQHAAYADPMSTLQAHTPIQQYNQQSFLSPSDSSSPLSREDHIPRGSPRRRLSYDETLILSRDRNNTIAGGTTTSIGTLPGAIRSSSRRRETHTPSRNRNVSIQRPSSAGPSSASPSSRQQHFRRQLQNASTSTSSSREIISSPTTSIDFNSLSLLSPSRTTITSNPTLLTRRREQSEAIITPHDFSTSVSLIQQHIVHDAKDNEDTGTSGESNPPITTTTVTTRDETPLINTNAVVTTTPEDTRLLRDYEDELQYLRDQWTIVCIALSSLRNMYLAVAASSPSPTRFVDPATTTGKSTDHPSSSSSPSSSNITQQKQQKFIDFPIPSSVTVTSFVGTTAPLNTATYVASSSSSSSSRNNKPPNNSSEKSSKGGRRGKGRRGDNGNDQQQRESPRGLHPDVEHEMLVGYDDAMLQLRQLQIRVETLEIEIRRLRGQPAVAQEENSRSNSSSPNE